MSTPNSKPPGAGAGAGSNAAKPTTNNKPPPPTYVSSSGHMLETPPLSARFSRHVDDIYNFLGLYFVSLFSLDAYTAAQNSSFNTRVAGGNNAYQERARWGNNGTTNRGGNNSSSGGRGGGGGGGQSGGGQSGRRLGTVDDVREPECGSCG